MELLNCSTIDASWQPLISRALQTLDPKYLLSLQNTTDWLPGKSAIFNAFSLPLHHTKYILFGESPYPRLTSANGYAFWDAAVNEIWAPKGLSTQVNRATSLRNFIKMLLVAQGDLAHSDTSQPSIAKLNKANYIKTLAELFNNLLQHGFLLLNASLVLSQQAVSKDVAAWRPFMDSLLTELQQIQPDIKLVLFGNMAKVIGKLPIAAHYQCICAEHPYNISFITNPDVLSFFRSYCLLEKQ